MTIMTELSKYAYEEAVFEDKSIKEAVDFLEKQLKMRTLKENLAKFYKEEQLRSVLVDGLKQNHPDTSLESIKRRVRGWLNNPLGSVKKQDAIEICFILKLSVEEADALIAYISGETLHWRNPDEIVFIFALKQKKDYLYAVKLNKEMQKIFANVKEDKNPSEDSFTSVIQKEILALNTEEELKEYLGKAVIRLGRCHNNAYHLFMEMMDKLEHPGFYETTEYSETLGNERLTIREILREYFYENNVMYAKKMARESKKKNSTSKEEKFVLSVIQKNISNSWPDETVLSKMKSRKTDVTRKVLILLFLATDTGLDFDDEEPTKDEIFQDLYSRLNDMLALCGFQQLDPRNPFDWLILYCICVQDITEVDTRMKQMLRELFGEEKETTKENKFIPK